jgi:(S)-2-hydroxyglutarate dehydrogenase
VDADVTVIGAGIVGLATARALQRRLGADVVVVDKELAPGLHQTGRNSGVVHSGLYYAPGSAKAVLVAEGRRMLMERCRQWGVPVEPCGKVVVATRVAQIAALDELERRGRRNGVEVARLTPGRLARIEPHVSGLAALHVPQAAITDFGAVARSLADEVQGDGATMRYGSAVTSIRQRTADGAGLEVGTAGGTFTTRWLVNCAGLHSDRIARLAGADTGIRIVPFRGEYHELTASARDLVRHLVYPVPDPRWPFLGVHLTRMVDGSVHVGPNAVLALGREAYERQVDRRDLAELVAFPGLQRLARRYWRTGIEEIVRSRSRRLLFAEVRRLVPELGLEDLVPSRAGIRAQAVAADGTLLDDFAVATSPRAVHVLNAPSPAASASLAIAEVVTDRLVRLIGR